MVKISMDKLSPEEISLISASIAVRNNAYTPYSKFHVGAALYDENNYLHTGCNVESGDYTLTSHAEMVAIDSMVKTGAREVKTIAISMHSDGGVSVPCGLCRQKISEFTKSDCKILCVNLNEHNQVSEIHATSLSELLPHAFGKEYFWEE